MSPEYRPFDAACRRVPALFRAGRDADARHVLDVAAAQVSRDVADETCDLVRVGGGL